VDDALGLVLDHLDQDLDGSLEAPGHARGRLARGAPQEEAAQHADDDGKEHRVPCHDRHVERTGHFLVAQVRQVVNDVFTCGGSMRCGVCFG
jgi:hypothetical protein